MSDTGFPRFPAGAAPNVLGGQTRGAEGNAQLISAPPNVLDDVQTLRQSVRLQGEVIQENKDGSVRVRTERGDIDVRAQDVRPAPTRGARVEVEIAPQRDANGGRSDRVDSATVRVIRPAPEETVRVRDNATPVEVDVRPQTRQSADQASIQTTARDNNAQLSQLATRTITQSAPPSAQGLPPEGALVRLTPAPPVINAVNAAAETLNQLISTSAQPLALASLINAAQSDGLPIVTARPSAAVIVPSAAILTPNSLQVGGAQVSTPPIAVIAPPTINGIAPAPVGGLQVTAPSTGDAIAPLPATRAQSVDVRINSVQAPALILSAPLAGAAPASQGPAPNVITNNQSAGALTGVVSGVGSGNLPQVSVFFPQSGQTQQFALQVPSPDVVVGARIEVTPQASTGLNSAAVAASTLPLAAQVAPQPWALLEDIQVHLAKAAPRAAMAMSAMTPSPANPAQFGPAVLFFIAAVRGGDITQWLSERGLDVLSKSGKGLLSKLSQEGQTLTQSAREAAAQDWRTVNLPMAWEGQIHKVALYYKHENAPEDGGIEGAQGTRFVFDLSLDRMGQVQVDGLFRPVSVDGKRLDIMVRTEEIFSEATRAEMRRVYANALRHTDVGGELSFQNDGAQWVTVQSATREALGVDA
jgi:hypothetical protein